MSIESSESQEYKELFNSDRLLLDSNSYNSLFFYPNTLGGYHKTEEPNLIGIKLTLVRVCKESSLLQPFKDNVYILLVVFRVLREDQDVIQIDNVNNIYQSCQDIVNIGLEYSWGINKTKWDN